MQSCRWRIVEVLGCVANWPNLKLREARGVSPTCRARRLPSLFVNVGAVVGSTALILSGMQPVLQVTSANH